MLRTPRGEIIAAASRKRRDSPKGVAVSQRQSIARVLCLVVLLAVLTTGCGRDWQLPSAVSPHANDLEVAAAELCAPDMGASGFYPLEIGNRWSYKGAGSQTTAPWHGDPLTTRGTWTREAVLVRSEALGGKSFVREERINREQTQDVHAVRWLRQDRRGLYEVGTPPPPRDSVVYPFPYEAHVLSYPIHRGARWTIDEARRITAEVERLELLNTPAGRFPAWRIRIRNGGHLPGEEAFVWYGHAGYLGMTVHVQFEKRDQNGDRITITQDQAEWVQTIDLVRREPHAALIAEAKESLMTVLAGEQVYFQKFLKFATVADTADIRVKLGVDLSQASRRWAFSVSGISFTGFVAKARGRDDTDAEGLVVTLGYQRWQPLVWTVENMRRRPHR